MTPDNPVLALVAQLREYADKGYDEQLDCATAAAQLVYSKAAVVLVQQAARIQQLEAAIRWALGEEGDFSEEPPPLAGKYRQRFWWRTELRRRAALSPRQEPTP